MIIDLFAAAGGWSEGLRMLGLVELGIEIDADACATARAAGHERLQANVSVLSPRDFAPCQGVIASPPCPTFSAAGRGAGRLLTDVLIAAMRDLAAGRDTRAERQQEAFEALEPAGDWAREARATTKRRRARAWSGRAERLARREARLARARRDAAMSMLVVEPLRWALALQPEWIALEQVPEVLASRTRVVHPPAPTHQRYRPGEPARHEYTLMGEILPWVSMAEALGWEEGPEPAPSPTATPVGCRCEGGVAGWLPHRKPDDKAAYVDVCPARAALVVLA